MGRRLPEKESTRWAVSREEGQSLVVSPSHLCSCGSTRRAVTFEEGLFAPEAVLVAASLDSGLRCSSEEGVVLRPRQYPFLSGKVVSPACGMPAKRTHDPPTQSHRASWGKCQHICIAPSTLASLGPLVCVAQRYQCHPRRALKGGGLGYRGSAPDG